MRKTIFIHIGTEKTGTTSLQHFCANNSSWLESQDLYYPSDQKLKHTYNVTHWTLAAAISKNKQFITNDCVYKPEDVYKSLIKDIESQRCSRVMISAEPFSSEVKSMKEIKLIKKFLSDYHIKIIVYLRRQDNAFISRVSTNIKGGRYFANGINSNEPLLQPHLYDYDRLLTMWSEVFGYENIFVRIYENNKLINHSIIDDFMNIMDIVVDYGLCKSIETKNTSLSLSCLHFLNSINGSTTLTRADRHTLVDILEGISLGGPISNILTKVERANILDYYAESNSKVGQKFFDGCNLFNDKIVDSNQQYQFIYNEAYEIIKVLVKSPIIEKIRDCIYGNMIDDILNSELCKTIYEMNEVPQTTSNDVARIYFMNNQLYIESTGNDPWFIIALNESQQYSKLKIQLNVFSEKMCLLQVFYRKRGNPFLPCKQITEQLLKGDNIMFMQLNNDDIIDELRIDIGNCKGTYIVSRLVIKSF